MKRSLLIKLTVSAAMLALILHSTRTDSLIATIKQIEISWVLIITAGYVTGQFLSSFKWWLILRASGLSVSYAMAMRAYFAGMFANCFGFGTIGGDLARALIVSAGTDQKAEALSSVVADRAHGLGVLSLLGLIATVYFGAGSSFTPYLVALAVLVPVGWFAGPWIVKRFYADTWPMARKLKKLTAAFPQDLHTVALISAVSLVFHLTQMGLHLLMAQAFNVTLPISRLLTSIPFVNIVSTLPISWNGLGVRESAYKYFLVPDVLNVETAVGFGALWLVAVTASSAIGGLVAVLTGDWQDLKRKS